MLAFQYGLKTIFILFLCLFPLGLWFHIAVAKIISLIFLCLASIRFKFVLLLVALDLLLWKEKAGLNWFKTEQYGTIEGGYMWGGKPSPSCWGDFPATGDRSCHGYHIVTAMNTSLKISAGLPNFRATSAHESNSWHTLPQVCSNSHVYSCTHDFFFSVVTGKLPN